MEAIAQSGVEEGLCVVYCPHTTAAITVNENADPDVKADLSVGLHAAFPDTPAFRHGEGNSAAHLKSSCLGASKTLIVTEGRPLLGTWQGVWFCEFDGPRTRHFLVKVMEG
jgi:secondary thiamine-phosphate synthase enzyme